MMWAKVFVKASLTKIIKTKNLTDFHMALSDVDIAKMLGRIELKIRVQTSMCFCFIVPA